MTGKWPRLPSCQPGGGGPSPPMMPPHDPAQDRLLPTHPLPLHPSLPVFLLPSALTSDGYASFFWPLRRGHSLRTRGGGGLRGPRCAFLLTDSRRPPDRGSPCWILPVELWGRPPTPVCNPPHPASGGPDVPSKLTEPQLRRVTCRSRPLTRNPIRLNQLRSLQRTWRCVCLGTRRHTCSLYLMRL